MLLRHIYLFLKIDEYSNELVTSFGFKTRYICNFIEKRLKKLKFHADGFGKICVQGTSRPENLCPIVSENAMLAQVKFNEDQYQNLGPSEHHEFFLSMLQEGLDKCASQHKIPLIEIQKYIEDFRLCDYKNEWIHQTKIFKAVEIRASIFCSLDTERFVLALQLERKGKIIFRKPVLETKPDEIIFEHRFKEVVLEGNTVVLKNKFGKSVYSLDLSLLRPEG